MALIIIIRVSKRKRRRHKVPKYYGKNAIRSSVRLFYERANFHLNAYDNLDIADHVRDITFG